MTTERVRPNDSIPILVGAYYRLSPSSGGQWIQITAADNRYVYAVGVFNNQAHIKLRYKKFDDIVVECLGFFALLTDKYEPIQTNDRRLIAGSE